MSVPKEMVKSQSQKTFNDHMTRSEPSSHWQESKAGLSTATFLLWIHF